MAEHMTQDPVTRVTPRSQMHWWQDWKWVASIAFVVAAIAIGAWSLASIRTNVTVDKLAGIAADNQNTLTRLDRNQAGIDELVAFVHEFQAQQASQASGQGQSKVATDIIALLCSSSDPVRQAACHQLGYAGVQPAGG